MTRTKQPEFGNHPSLCTILFCSLPIARPPRAVAEAGVLPIKASWLADCWARPEQIFGDAASALLPKIRFYSPLKTHL
jgi:hypothetical protein